MSLTISKLNVKLQKDEILHEVNLHVEEGEFISLLGESGCGKSTLLKSIAGLLPLQSGDIYIQDQFLNDMPPEKRGTVIVFQDLRLFPHMSVEKNIAFAMELQKVPENIRKATVEQLLEEVQLPGYGHRKIKEMSGGQLQRVALARALAARPRVLLLDEPFSGLDERLRFEMGALVKKIHQERKITTILVTHDKREALQMSDRIALMHEGDILQYDTPQRIFYNPSSKKVADYFGKANYIVGNVRNGIFKSKEVSLNTAVSDGEYEALIRPASVKLVSGDSKNSIREIVFMGETAEVLVDTTFGDLLCFMMSGELEREQLKVGSKVNIEIDKKRINYFPVSVQEEETGDN